MISVTEFKQMVLAGKASKNAVIRKDGPTNAPDALDERRVKFTISSAAVDRDNDSVAVEGWQLDNFRRNPVVLWGHDQGSLPIGRVVDLTSEGGCLKATVEFVPADVPVTGPMAEAVLRLCRTGFLSATSVGFRPLQWELANDPTRSGAGSAPGVNFKQQELLELSIVTVPANHEALIEQNTLIDMARSTSADKSAGETVAAKADDGRARRARALRVIARRGISLD